MSSRKKDISRSPSKKFTLLLRVGHLMQKLVGKSIAVLLMLAIAAFNVGGGQSDLTTLVNQVRSSVVTVIGFNGDGKPIAQGTGFFVASNGTLITNYHVLAEARKASIKTRSGKVYDIVETLAEDIDGDLTAVRANVGALVVRPLRISRAPVLPGQRIVVIGSPLGLDQTVSEGIVSAVRQTNDLGTLIQITAAISPGSSGSPVVNINGEIVGVATLYLKAGQNLNFAIASNRITSLLNRSIKAVSGPSRRRRAAPRNPNVNAKTKQEDADFDEWIAKMLDEERRSIPSLEDRIKKNPPDIKAYEDLARAYENSGDPKRAIEVYQKALLLVSSDKRLIHAALCDAYSDVEEYEKALNHCESALRLNPTDKEGIYLTSASHILTGKGRALIGLGRNGEAIQVLKKAVEENPDTSAHEQLGIAYMNLGQYEDAVKAFEFMASIASRYAPSFANLAWAYESLGRDEAAEINWKKAIQIDSKFDEAYVRLAKLYEREDRLTDAISIYRQAIKINAKNGDAYLGLGFLYLSRGDRRSTLDIYESLKKIDPAKAKQLSGAIYQ